MQVYRRNIFKRLSLIVAIATASAVSAEPMKTEANSSVVKTVEIAVREGVDPSVVRREHLAELQATLEDDDQMLPFRWRKPNALTLSAKTDAANEVLRNGIDRKWKGADNGVWLEAGGEIVYRWEKTVQLAGARIVFDSDLKVRGKRMRKLEATSERVKMPAMLAKNFRLEAEVAGEWKVVYRDAENFQRLRKVVFAPVEATALKLVVESAWGGEKAHVFAFDAKSRDEVGYVGAFSADYDTLIAHRGESYDAPENTLPAYRTAVERGFGFECDIYLSKDGRLFTFHDRNLIRTSGGVYSNKCTEASWEDQVSKLDVGSWGKWKGSSFAGTRPALFKEVLALARPGRKIYVEVKSSGEDCAGWAEKIEADCAAEAKATPETVLFISFDGEMCAELKRRMPEYKVYWLSNSRVSREKWAPLVSVEQLLEKLKAAKADGLDVTYDPELVTAEFIAKIESAGFEVHVWTVDDPKNAAEAFRRGARTVTTNRARYLLECLK